jgi:hypothetical protein
LEKFNVAWNGLLFRGQAGEDALDSLLHWREPDGVPGGAFGLPGLALGFGFGGELFFQGLLGGVEGFNPSIHRTFFSV